MIHFLSPGDPDLPTGGYRYNARLVEGLRARGVSVTVHPLAYGWPTPEAAELAEAAERVRPLEGTWIADGLLWTSLAPRVEPGDRRVVALVHSPLWREHGVAARALEESALGRATRVVCTSRRIRDDLTFATPSTVIEPGTDPGEPVVRPGAWRLLSIGSLVPRKGHDVLLTALRMLRRLGPRAPVTLRCAGGAPDPAYAEALRAQAADLPVTWLGPLAPAELERELAQAGLLVQAAHYEGYGMAIAEALARGLPVVSPPAGVLDGLRGGHRLVPPGDPAALARAVEAISSAPAEARALAAEARAIALPQWDDQVQRWLDVLEEP